MAEKLQQPVGELEFAGKLNFYVNAVDELIKTPKDNEIDDFGGKTNGQA